MELIFLKVLNMSISASWLVLVVLALRFLLKKSPRWLHVCLWALVAMRLVCPFSIESVLSLIPSTETLPREIIYAKTPAIESGVEIVNDAVNSTVMTSLAPEGLVSINPVQVWLLVGEMVWYAGMVLLLLWALISYFRLKQKVSASIDLGNGIYLCDYIDTPFILGIIRPKIYLPSAMEPDSASHVLAHERAHIARKDHWWKPFGYLLLTVHWFNPLMWLAYILLCRDIELACDEKVVRQMALPERKSYSDALLQCSVRRMHVAACPLAFGEVGVKERVKSVLNYRKPAFWLVLVSVLALTVTALCFLTDPVDENQRDSSQDVSNEVTIRDGVADKSYNISHIYWMAYLGDAGTVTIHNADTEQTTEVSCDLDSYTISDSAGTRTYRHCVMSFAESEYGTVTEYFFLTDEPEMTAEKYLSGEEILPTEVLYIDRRSFDAAQIFGDVPPEIEALMAAQQDSAGTFYCPDTVFCVKYRLLMDSAQYAYVLERLDYAGNLLYSFDVKGYPQEILELEDGGFAVVTYFYEDSLYELSCYDADATQHWVYSFDYGGSVYVPALFARNGDIYCFGQVTPRNSSSDIYIWRISMDGQLVQEKHFTGSDFESIHRVQETDAGFTIYGSSQSGDGDFPFSKDGYGEYFVAQVSADLERLSAEKADSCYGYPVGYREGQPVFDDDPILDISKKDNFPEGMHYGVSGIFDWEDGYVVVRRVYFESYLHGNPLISRAMYYSQKIVTGYDSNGNPLWQTAGGIQMD